MSADQEEDRMTETPLTAGEVAALHDPDLWYEAFVAVSGDEARTPNGRREIYKRWRAALVAAEGTDVERHQLADDLIDAVEEALGSEMLPGNIHRRLQVAYDDWSGRHD